MDPSILIHKINIELAERNLYEFVKHTWKYVNPFYPFRDNWHIGCICEHLQAMTELQIKRLIINVPPRHLKSLLSSVFWVAWTWLHDPSSQWMFASYKDTLAERDSSRCRDLIKHKGFVSDFQPGWALKDDYDRKDVFKNTFGGTRMCTVFSPQSSATGFDSHYQVIDDPHSVNDKPNRIRETCEMYSKTYTTRANDPGDMRRLIIGQRVDEYDLSGVQIAKDFGWEHLCIPFRHEPKRFFWTRQEAKKAGQEYPIIPTTLQAKRAELMDPRKEEGDLIHPARFPGNSAHEWEVELGLDGDAQLRQAPSKEKGRIFNREDFRRYKIFFSNRLQEQAFKIEQVGSAKPYVCGFSECRFFQVADTAMTGKDTSSYVVNGTFAITPRGQLLVYHIWRAQLELAYQYPALIKLRVGPTIWHADIKKLQRVGEWPFTLLFQAVENKSSGPGLIDMGKANGMPFKVLNPKSRDKVQRAAPLTTQYQQGMVLHPHDGDWVPVLEKELIRFPKGDADDQVDVLAYASHLLSHDTILRQYLNATMVHATQEDFESARVREEQVDQQRFTFRVGGSSVDVRFDD